jgi:Protein of unknown function with HXXEE motif
MAMTTETLMWLFPSVFMLHEFEEIIGFRPWWDQNRNALLKRYPRVGQRLRLQYDPLSTSSFALVVAEEFVLVSALTLLCVLFGWTSFFAGLVIAYLIHLGVHTGQFLLWRRYVPMIATSLLTAPLLKSTTNLGYRKQSFALATLATLATQAQHDRRGIRRSQLHR